MSLLVRLLVYLTFFHHVASSAFGPDGHHTIGALADRLIAGTNAEKQVKALLGGLSLQEAAVWADCAKGVNVKTLVYESAGKYPECKIYEDDPAAIAAMEDFVTRNLKQCNPGPHDEVCHRGYHYTDIAIQHSEYELGLVGSRDTDIVHAIRAAMIVLQGGRSPAPIDFKDRREALLVLAHYVGDVHQPLHVGSIYLSAAGRRVNPDLGHYDPATFTTGANDLLVDGVPAARLHGRWDGVPASLTPTHVDQLMAAASAIPRTKGSLPDWPTTWANESLPGARKAFVGMKFGPKSGGKWRVTLPASYTTTMNQIKTERVEAAGAHLAQIIMAIWP